MKKPKNKERRSNISMTAVFTVFVIVSYLILTVVYAGLIEMLHQNIDSSRNIPDWVWFVIICTMLGAVVTAFVLRMFFAPISKLRNAMHNVAEGDFDTRLEVKKSDIKDIKQITEDFNLMASELGATEILQTNFVSNVSHEFKTPISAIEGYTTLLQDESLTEQERKQYIEKIIFNTRRLSNLVGNILLLSKVDNQSISTKQTEYRLDEQIRQSIVSLEPRWTEKNTEFDAELDSITYFGNESLMMHVWNNLIENAIKFGPEGQTIRIRLYSEGESIIFTIDDEGEGISESAKKHIFDRFYQEDSSHKVEGNGLGLALVKQILNISNGEIEAENLEEGGCRFTVKLS